jgi:hypothetical protein
VSYAEFKDVMRLSLELLSDRQTTAPKTRLEDSTDFTDYENALRQGKPRLLLSSCSF